MINDYGSADRGRCADCPQPHMRCVPTDGPPSSHILFVGEAPGRDEDNGGRPFVGRAGGEFNNNYLRIAGLERNQILITNTVRCRPDGTKKPSPRLRSTCSTHHLAEELSAHIQPDIIVPMGATACSLFEDVDLSVHHGFPLTRNLWGRNYTLFPVYHPAAGLHSSGMVAPLIWDFTRLGQFLDGSLRVPQYTYKGREDYTDVHGDEVRDLIRNRYQYPPAIDTESVRRRLWSTQFSVTPGTGYLIWPEDRVGMQHLVDACNRHGYTMHYSTEDWGMLAKHGWRLDDSPGKLYDTIQAAFVQAYHSGGAGGGENSSGGMWGGLGLKALTWRMVGLQMGSYKQLVTGASKQAVLRWIEAAKAAVPVRYEFLKTKTKEKPGRLITVLNRIERYTRDSEDYDPWDRWEEAQARISSMPDGPERDEWEAELLIALDEAGPIPLEGIDQAPRDQAIQYACEDANATGLLRVALEELDGELAVSRRVAEKDWVI